MEREVLYFYKSPHATFWVRSIFNKGKRVPSQNHLQVTWPCAINIQVKCRSVPFSCCQDESEALPGEDLLSTHMHRWREIRQKWVAQSRFVLLRWGQFSLFTLYHHHSLFNVYRAILQICSGLSQNKQMSVGQHNSLLWWKNPSCWSILQ